MNRTAMFIAISGTLRPVPAAVIAPKDWRASNSATGTDSVATVALPASAVAGDYCVVGLTDALSVTAPSGWGVQYQDAPTGGSMAYGVFSKKLTASDISAGSVAISMSGNSRWAAIAMIWQAGKIGGVDVKSAANFVQENLFAPFTLTANGVTTSVENTQLLAIFHTFVSSGYTAAPTPESGWTGQSSKAVSGYYEYGVTVAYKAQAAAGVTGDVLATDDTSGHAIQSSASLLLALKPAAPAIALTYDLPATATIGTPYTGSITATLVDGATGPVTITATPLPAGVAAGSVVDNGDGTYTLPISGTPTTAETANWTADATNGVLNAPQASGSIVVSEASAAPVLVQQKTGPGSSSVGTQTLTLDSAPTPGNTLVMFCQASNTISATTPSGWTLVAKPSAASGQRAIYTRFATGAGATITSPAMSGTSNFEVQEWQGSVTVTPAATGTSVAGSGMFSVGGLAAPTASAIPVFAATPNNTTQTDPYSWPAGWTARGPDTTGAFPRYGATIAAGAATASAVSAVNVSYSGTRNDGNIIYWMGAWIA